MTIFVPFASVAVIHDVTLHFLFPFCPYMWCVSTVKTNTIAFIYYHQYVKEWLVTGSYDAQCIYVCMYGNDPYQTVNGVHIA